MIYFWGNQAISKPIRGESMLHDHHQEDQEYNGCPPSRISRCPEVVWVFCFSIHIYAYFFKIIWTEGSHLEVTQSLLNIIRKIRKLKNILHLGSRRLEC